MAFHSRERPLCGPLLSILAQVVVLIRKWALYLHKKWICQNGIILLIQVLFHRARWCPQHCIVQVTQQLVYFHYEYVQHIPHCGKPFFKFSNSSCSCHSVSLTKKLKQRTRSALLYCFSFFNAYIYHCLCKKTKNIVV